MHDITEQRDDETTNWLTDGMSDERKSDGSIVFMHQDDGRDEVTEREEPSPSPVSCHRRLDVVTWRILSYVLLDFLRTVASFWQYAIRL